MTTSDEPKSGTPGAETKEALIAAAMAHLGTAGTASFFVPVPGTHPPLFVALGTLETLTQALAARAQLTDH